MGNHVCTEAHVTSLEQVLGHVCRGTPSPSTSHLAAHTRSTHGAASTARERGPWHAAPTATTATASPSAAAATAVPSPPLLMRVSCDADVHDGALVQSRAALEHVYRGVQHSVRAFRFYRRRTQMAARPDGGGDSNDENDVQTHRRGDDSSGDDDDDSDASSVASSSSLSRHARATTRQQQQRHTHAAPPLPPLLPPSSSRDALTAVAVASVAHAAVPLASRATVLRATDVYVVLHIQRHLVDDVHEQRQQQQQQQQHAPSFASSQPPTPTPATSRSRAAVAAAAMTARPALTPRRLALHGVYSVRAAEMAATNNNNNTYSSSTTAAVSAPVWASEMRRVCTPRGLAAPVFSNADKPLDTHRNDDDNDVDVTTHRVCAVDVSRAADGDDVTSAYDNNNNNSGRYRHGRAIPPPPPPPPTRPRYAFRYSIYVLTGKQAHPLVSAVATLHALRLSHVLRAQPTLPRCLFYNCCAHHARAHAPPTHTARCAHKDDDNDDDDASTHESLHRHVALPTHGDRRHRQPHDGDRDEHNSAAIVTAAVPDDDDDATAAAVVVAPPVSPPPPTTLSRRRVVTTCAAPATAATTTAASDVAHDRQRTRRRRKRAVLPLCDAFHRPVVIGSVTVTQQQQQQEQQQEQQQPQQPHYEAARAAQAMAALHDAYERNALLRRVCATLPTPSPRLRLATTMAAAAAPLSCVSSPAAAAVALPTRTTPRSARWSGTSTCSSPRFSVSSTPRGAVTAANAVMSAAMTTTATVMTAAAVRHVRRASGVWQQGPPTLEIPRLPLHAVTRNNSNNNDDNNADNDSSGDVVAPAAATAMPSVPSSSRGMHDDNDDDDNDDSDSASARDDASTRSVHGAATRASAHVVDHAHDDASKSSDARRVALPSLHLPPPQHHSAPLHVSNTNCHASSHDDDDDDDDDSKQSVPADVTAVATTHDDTDERRDAHCDDDERVDDKDNDDDDDETRVTDARAQRLRALAPEATEVLPWLFVGGETAARDAAQLRAKGVTAVVNTVAYDVPALHREWLRDYLPLYVSDVASEPIFRLFAVVNAFVEGVRARGGRTLVHCHQGVSRSCALVIAYLMWRRGVCYDRAYAFVRARRGVCSPNAGFYANLRLWEQHLTRPALYGVYAYLPYSVAYVAPYCYRLVDAFASPTATATDTTAATASAEVAAAAAAVSSSSVAMVAAEQWTGSRDDVRVVAATQPMVQLDARVCYGVLLPAAATNNNNDNNNNNDSHNNDTTTTTTKTHAALQAWCVCGDAVPRDACAAAVDAWRRFVRHYFYTGPRTHSTNDQGVCVTFTTLPALTHLCIASAHAATVTTTAASDGAAVATTMTTTTTTAAAAVAAIERRLRAWLGTSLYTVVRAHDTRWDALLSAADAAATPVTTTTATTTTTPQADTTTTTGAVTARRKRRRHRAARHRRRAQHQQQQQHNAVTGDDTAAAAAVAVDHTVTTNATATAGTPSLALSSSPSSSVHTKTAEASRVYDAVTPRGHPRNGHRAHDTQPSMRTPAAATAATTSNESSNDNNNTANDDKDNSDDDAAVALGDYEVYRYPFTAAPLHDVMGMCDLRRDGCYAVVVPHAAASSSNSSDGATTTTTTTHTRTAVHDSDHGNSNNNSARAKATATLGGGNAYHNKSSSSSNDDSDDDDGEHTATLRMRGAYRHRVYIWLGSSCVVTAAEALHAWRQHRTRDAATAASSHVTYARRVCLHGGAVLHDVRCDIVHEGAEPDELLLVLD